MTGLQLKRFYDFEENEDHISAVIKDPSLIQWIVHGIVMFLFSAPFAFMAYIGVLKGHAFFAVVGFVFLPVTVIMSYKEIKGWKKLKDTFKFSIDETGVSVNDMAGENYISWQDIASFGVVNRTVERHSANPGIVRYQACMYFSKTTQEETGIKEMLTCWNDKCESTEEMIVFPFGFDTDRYEEYDLFRKYIYMYCDKSKEHNYVKEII